jgi:nucleolar protein 6
MDDKLSKRKKKALAFRGKKDGKVKEDGDEKKSTVNEENAKPSWLGKDAPGKPSGKKRKRTDDVTDPATGTGPSQSTKKPGKRKAQVSDSGKDASAGPPSKKQKTKEPAAKRYIVFVGNLPHKPSAELLPALQAHFPTSPKSVRMPTKKGSNAPQGFAFVEFETAPDIEKALRCHHTIFMGRKINVELTAGGGGRGEKRMEKIRTRNETLAEERRKRILEEEAEKKGKEKGKESVDGIHPSRIKLMKTGQNGGK